MPLGIQKHQQKLFCVSMAHPFHIISCHCLRLVKGQIWSCLHIRSALGNLGNAQQLYCLHFSDTRDLHKLPDIKMIQTQKSHALAGKLEDISSKFDRCSLPRSGSEHDSKKLGIRKTIRSKPHKLIIRQLILCI